VTDDLPRLGARRAEAHAVRQIVEPAFQPLQQRFAGNAAAARRMIIAGAELPLEQTVDTAQLLLFTQLHAVAGQAAVALAVLSRRIIAPLDRTLVGKTLLALEEQFFALTAALTALRVKISRHAVSPCQIRRFLGGRQPLCGTGVTSAMLVILNPTALSARTADSRPGPGPLMRTSRFFTPHSCASLPARSAVTWAANGVLLREPLKPLPPHVPHASVLPWRSVMVTMVLLKEA
jgi:hypothetical protein